MAKKTVYNMLNVEITKDRSQYDAKCYAKYMFSIKQGEYPGFKSLQRNC